GSRRVTRGGLRSLAPRLETRLLDGRPRARAGGRGRPRSPGHLHDARHADIGLESAAASFADEWGGGSVRELGATSGRDIGRKGVEVRAARVVRPRMDLVVPEPLMADDQANVAERLSGPIDHRARHGAVVGPNVADLDVLGAPILGHEALLG